ncbi:hypothetical protein LIER_43650 [Lithospermum erythrorhizon]|uniref:Integrase catalytic domain-containing protein n=1 Tax=Lithospermum erythrorhizon TaxID=34254 RepID=A0AAV3QHH1_LITER
MIGNKSYLIKIEKLKGDCITFRGGAKGKITGKGCLSVDGLPELENVLLADGLTVNLISISQLCDEGMKVAFTKEACVVSNISDKLIMKGTRSPDNCYLWSPHKVMSCRTEEDVEMWHIKLGHTNYRNIQQLIFKEAVKGLPKLEIKEKICGKCRVGKQTKVSHQREKGMAIIRIKSDHGKEFENSKFNDFYSSEGIKHEFLAPITPQQNGIVQRKNRTIQHCMPYLQQDHF